MSEVLVVLSDIVGVEAWQHVLHSRDTMMGTACRVMDWQRMVDHGGLIEVLDCFFIFHNSLVFNATSLDSKN